MKDYVEVKKNPEEAIAKGSNTISINEQKLDRLRKKYDALLKRMQAIAGVSGMFAVGMMSSTHSFPIAIAGGVIAYGAGMLIAKTHQLILKRKIEKLEKEEGKRR